MTNRQGNFIESSFFTRRWPRIRFSSNSTAFSATASEGWATVVNAGRMYREIVLLSNPVTARSSGTRHPASAQASNAPTADSSLLHRSASGRTPSASIFWMAMRPKT